MTLLKGLNFTLLISGPQVGLANQNPYEAPQSMKKRASYLLSMTGFVGLFYCWEGTPHPVHAGVNKQKWSTAVI